MPFSLTHADAGRSNCHARFSIDASSSQLGNAENAIMEGGAGGVESSRVAGARREVGTHDGGESIIAASTQRDDFESK